jgi:hypothetical protein
MPFRDAELVDRCDVCEEAAIGRCRRCGRPSCREHSFGDRGLCTDCEAALYLQLAPPRRAVRVALRQLAVVATVCTALAVAGYGFASWAACLLSPSFALLTTPALEALDRRRATNRFVRELGGDGRAPRLLGTGDPSSSRTGP